MHEAKSSTAGAAVTASIRTASAAANVTRGTNTDFAKSARSTTAAAGCLFCGPATASGAECDTARPYRKLSFSVERGPSAPSGRTLKGGDTTHGPEAATLAAESDFVEVFGILGANLLDLRIGLVRERVEETVLGRAAVAVGRR